MNKALVFLILLLESTAYCKTFTWSPNARFVGKEFAHNPDHWKDENGKVAAAVPTKYDDVVIPKDKQIYIAHDTKWRSLKVEKDAIVNVSKSLTILGRVKPLDFILENRPISKCEDAKVNIESGGEVIFEGLVYLDGCFFEKRHLPKGDTPELHLAGDAMFIQSGSRFEGVDLFLSGNLNIQNNWLGKVANFKSSNFFIEGGRMDVQTRLDFDMLCLSECELHVSDKGGIYIMGRNSVEFSNWDTMEFTEATLSFQNIRQKRTKIELGSPVKFTHSRFYLEGSITAVAKKIEFLSSQLHLASSDEGRDDEKYEIIGIQSPGISFDTAMATYLPFWYSSIRFTGPFPTQLWIYPGQGDQGAGLTLNHTNVIMRGFFKRRVLATDADQILTTVIKREKRVFLDFEDMGEEGKNKVLLWNADDKFTGVVPNLFQAQNLMCVKERKSLYVKRPGNQPNQPQPQFQKFNAP